MYLRTVAGEHGRLERVGADDPGARKVELVIDVDGPAFAEHWLRTVAVRRVESTMFGGDSTPGDDPFRIQ
jgi:hypothetical protein